MALQSTVNFKQGFGVPGELYCQSPVRSQSFILNSGDAAYNVFGRAFTLVSEGVAKAGSSGGEFVGILANPKTSVLRGTTAGGPLAPSLTLPNNSQAEIVSMGSLVVSLPAAAAIGDLVIFDNTTGALETIAPGAALPTGKSFAFATVDYFTVSGAGLAVITLTPTLVIPEPEA